MDSLKAKIPITDIQRQRLRVYHGNNPSLTLQGLISWFEREYGRTIPLSSVSSILSDKYAYLDNSHATDATRKTRGPQCAELEEALFRYWQELQPCTVNGSELRSKAIELWKALYESKGKRMPSFSEGWLTKWRRRYGIAPYGKAVGGASRKRPWTDTELGGSSHNGTQQVGHLRGFNYHGIEIANALKRHCVYPGVAQTVTRGPMSYPRVRDIFTETDQSLCNGISSLFLEYSTQGTDNAHFRVPRATLLGIFGPLLAAAARHSFLSLYSDYYFGYGCTSAEAVAKVKQVMELLMASENFQLQPPPRESLSSSDGAWLLDWINFEHIRSPSPEPIELEENISGTPANSLGSMDLQNSRKPTSYTGMTSAVWGKWRVDAMVQSSKNANTAGIGHETEILSAVIAVTPPAIAVTTPRVMFRMQKDASHMHSPLSIPIISFQNVRPANSLVFKIARNGSSSALEMILSRGEASMSDCDPEGRSLINVSPSLEEADHELTMT
jgi:hypothetical protein